MLKSGDIQGKMHSSENPVPLFAAELRQGYFLFFHFRNLAAEHDTADFVESIQHFPIDWTFPENVFCNRLQIL